jgi:mRNA interferase YafQ
MLRLVSSGRFKRDTKRAAKRGKDMRKLGDVLDILLAEKPLDASYGDHPLKGDWKGWRDLHIEPDWLLIYRVVGDRLELAATGTHADLFDT